MRRTLVPLAVASLAALVAGIAFPVTGMAAVRPGVVSVHVPAAVRPGQPFVVRVKLPANVAAVDGRILLDTQAVEVWGWPRVGGGTAMRPEPVPGGVAFGAYGLHAVGGATTIRLILDARQAASVQVRVAVDALANRTGHRLALGRRITGATIDVGGGTVRRSAPVPAWDATPRSVPVAARDLLADGRVDRQDIDAARIGWDAARMAGAVCGSAGRLTGDANGDGCVDIVDVQAELAAQGSARPAAATATGNFTFTVVSAADTPDAAPGNGVCADASGKCTLRAAIAEANQDTGNDRVEFNLAGTPPVTISIATQLPTISSRKGTLTIDGYTQPGSQVNTASAGSNAVPGVEVRGPGVGANTFGIYITSYGNTVRGLALSEINRPVFIDHADAHDNRIVGDWIGFRRDGTAGGRPQYGVVLNTGANHNTLGTPLLADRNLIYGGTAVDLYGLGTEFERATEQPDVHPAERLHRGPVPDGHRSQLRPQEQHRGGSAPYERNVIGTTGEPGDRVLPRLEPGGSPRSGRPDVAGQRQQGDRQLGRLPGRRQLRPGIPFRADQSRHGRQRPGHQRLRRVQQQPRRRRTTSAPSSTASSWRPATRRTTRSATTSSAPRRWASPRR